MSLKNTRRKEGVLSPLKRQTIPKHLFFYDTEAPPIKSPDGSLDFEYLLGVGIYVKTNNKGEVLERKVFYPKSKEDFIGVIIDLAEKVGNLTCFAHNQGFDLRVLFAFTIFEALGWTSDPPIINNMVFIYGVKKDKTKISFIDTSNLGVRSVEQLGLDMGYEKQSIDFNNYTHNEMIEYCYRDTEILEKFVMEYIRFIIEHNLGSFKVTLASQALTAFRTSYMNEPIYIHLHNGALKLERDAYYGGRTESFKLGYIGLQEYFYIDVNSMYPYVMSNFPMPAELKGYSESNCKGKLLQYIDDYYCIADVTIEAKLNDYPLRLTNNPEHYNYLNNPNDLEYPKLTSKRLIFPTGKFRTTLHHAELVQAKENNELLEVHRISWYYKNYPFKEYIDHFNKAKIRYGKEDNKTWRKISKLFLNSLYGKFAQLQPQRQHVGINRDYQYNRIPEYDNVKQLFYQRLYWNYNEYIEFKLGETSFSNPAISGAVTAYARMYLNQSRRQAGVENVFYMDTDSMIVNRMGYENITPLLDKYELGKWDLEATARRLIIYGNKDYRLDVIKRHKGVSSKAIKKDFNLWEYLHFEGFISWWKKGAIGGAKGEYRTKSRSYTYYKGIVQDNGNIIPYHLQE